MDVILFGNGKITEVAYNYLKIDTDYNVVAFCIHDEYLNENSKSFDNLPLIKFSEVEVLYPPDKYLFFAPFSGTNMNKLREKIYNQIKEKNYKFISYISSKANIFTQEIGENCFILEDNTIQFGVKIGNNCVIWSGNHIGHHSTIEDHVFLTSHIVISGSSLIGKYSYIGVNASLRDSLIVAPNTLIGMGSVMTKDSEEYGVYVGNPGKMIKKCDDSIKI